MGYMLHGHGRPVSWICAAVRIGVAGGGEREATPQRAKFDSTDSGRMTRSISLGRLIR
jgi:hypothetical protein